MWFAASIWTVYGAVIGAFFPIAACNGWGIACATTYCAIFIRAAKPTVRRAAIRSAMIAAVLLTCVCLYLLLSWPVPQQR